jgi:hypothetical protein
MLTLGTATTGAMIHPMGDVDVYSFTLGGPTDVIIETDFQTPGCCFNEIDTVVTLYLDGVGLIDFGDDDDVGAGFTKIEAGVLPAGTYFLKVSTFPDLYNELLAALGFIPPGVPTNFSVTSIGVYSVSVTAAP